MSKSMDSETSSKNITRRQFHGQMMAGAAALLGIGSTGPGGGGGRERPNVIVLITDDQGPASLGCLGGDVLTPNIDRYFGREGLTLANAHVAAPVCCPSRYSTLTGRHAGRCRAPYYRSRHPEGTMNRVENNVELAPDVPNLASLLQANGYLTGHVGKFHLTKHEVMHGTDNWSEHGLETYGMAADPRDPDVTEKMRYNHNWWRRQVMRFGYDDAESVYGANLRELFNERANVHNVEWTVEGALRFIERSKDQPFFLSMATTVPHGPAPWIVEDGQLVKSLDADPRMSGEGYLDRAPDVMPPRGQIKQQALDAGKELRDAWATWWDEGVGVIVRKLQQHGLDENTLILLMSDHGHRRHGKATLYDNGMKVPMFVRWPAGIRGGAASHELVQNVDIAPTILDICGVQPPDGATVDGKSMRPLFRAPQTTLHEDLFGELGYARAVKTRRWKYIAIRYPDEVQAKIERGETFNGFQGREIDRPYLGRNGHLGHHAARQNPHYFEPDQLYDLEEDPRETVNLAGKYPDVVRKMKERLAAHLETFENRPFGEFV